MLGEQLEAEPPGTERERPTGMRQSGQLGTDAGFCFQRNEAEVLLHARGKRRHKIASLCRKPAADGCLFQIDVAVLHAGAAMEGTQPLIERLG